MYTMFLNGRWKKKRNVKIWVSCSWGLKSKPPIPLFSHIVHNSYMYRNTAVHQVFVQSTGRNILLRCSYRCWRVALCCVVARAAATMSWVMYRKVMRESRHTVPSYTHASMVVIVFLNHRIIVSSSHQATGALCLQQRVVAKSLFVRSTCLPLPTPPRPFGQSANRMYDV